MKKFMIGHGMPNVCTYALSTLALSRAKMVTLKSCLIDITVDPKSDLQKVDRNHEHERCHKLTPKEEPVHSELVQVDVRSAESESNFVSTPQILYATCWRTELILLTFLNFCVISRGTPKRAMEM